MKIGVISDTHGLLRPEVLSALQGCDHILHAGDVGEAEILARLESIAPVTAVRGNIDRRGPCSELPLTQTIELGSQNFHILHEIDKLDLNPAAAGFAAVVFGHSHSPKAEYRKKVLYFNPGSCGPRRFSLPVSLGFLVISNNTIKPELVTLL